MSTDEARALLARTGDLHTKTDDDPAFISSMWRATIVRLCDLVDASPVDAAALLHAERAAHVNTRQSLAAEIEDSSSLEWQAIQLKAQIADHAERVKEATRLIEEAAPRMRTLNNAMSPRWLARADEFLKGNV